MIYYQVKKLKKIQVLVADIITINKMFLAQRMHFFT